MADDDRKQPAEAVALKYDRGKEPAPRVVAKGRGPIAECEIIRVQAEENGITVYEDANLVEILGKLDIDSLIPLEAYAAVAEILNYVYKTNAKNKAMKRNTV